MPIAATVERRLDKIRGPGKRRSPSVQALASFAQNTDCRLATLGFAAGVNFDSLLAGTRFRPQFAQSPFAIQRGLAFEQMLRDNGHAAALDLLRAPLNLSPNAGKVANLRKGFPHGPNKMAARAKATRDLLRIILAGDSTAPHLIDGAVLTGSVGGRDAFFEADALAARAADNLLRVAEVKSFPRVDDRLDPDQFGTALDQIAVYVLLLRETVESLGGDSVRLVSDRGLLITPRNVSFTPTLSEASVASRIVRIRRVFASIPSAADVAAAAPSNLSFAPVADTTADEDKRLEALHTIADAVGTAYTPSCLSTCGNARFCRERAVGSGSPCISGPAAARLLPEVLTVGRAESLSHGAKPSVAEAPVAVLLDRAGRLIDETAAPAQPQPRRIA